MTPEMEAIERVRRVLPAVTPGVWRVESGTTLIWGASDREVMDLGKPIAEVRDRSSGLGPTKFFDENEVAANAEFIALSRVVVPALLSALSSRDEELSTAREEIARKDALIAELVRALREAKDTLSEDLMSLTRHDIFALQESVAAALTRAKEESNG